MKPLFCAALAAIALSLAACGQTTGSTPGNAPAGAPVAAPGMAPRPFADKLNLTADQRQKIEPIMRSTMTQMRSIGEDAHNRELAALSADHRAKVQQIIDQARSAMQAHMPPMVPPDANGGPPHRDMGQITAIRQQHQKIIAQIDSILSPSEKQAVISIGNDAHSKMTALHTSAINQIKPVLSADQAKMLDEMPMRGHIGMRAGRTPDAGAYLLMGAIGHMRPGMHPEMHP